MSNKKQKTPLDYDVNEFDIPVLRVEPAQVNTKPLKLPSFGIESIYEVNEFPTSKKLN